MNRCILEIQKIYKSQQMGDFYWSWQIWLVTEKRKRTYTIQPTHKNGYMSKDKAKLSAIQLIEKLKLSLLQEEIQTRNDYKEKSYD